MVWRVFEEHEMTGALKTMGKIINVLSVLLLVGVAAGLVYMFWWVVTHRGY